MHRRNFIKNSVISLLGLGALNNILGKNFKNIFGINSMSDEKFWKQIQDSFEVDRSIINLNNGGVSPSPKFVIDSIKKNIDYGNRLPSYYMWNDLDPQVETVREKLAYQFGCDKEEIAITRNTSEGTISIQYGIDFKEDDEIITTNQDYIRMLTAYQQLTDRHKIKVIQISYPVPLLDKNDIINKIEQAITKKTRLIHFSHICYLTGQILPAKEIIDLAHKNNIEVLCDGAHSFNQIPFKYADLNCDYFTTSLHKWTYAPIGTGMLFIKKDKIKNIWNLMGSPAKMQNDIRKFEEIGTHQAALKVAIQEAIDFNNTLGIEKKSQRLRYLNNIWINRIKKYDKIKFLVDIENPQNYCGLVTFSIKDTDPEKFSKHILKKYRVFTQPIIHDEYKGIRVTPNIYTTETEVNYFADVIEELL